MAVRAHGPRRSARRATGSRRPSRGDRPGRGVPARALRERVLLGARARAHRHDVRRDAGRRRVDAGLPARQHRPAAARERRRPLRADAAPGRGVAGAGRPGRAGRPLDGRAHHAGGRARSRSDRSTRRGPTWSPTSSRSGPRTSARPIARGIGHGSRGLGGCPRPRRSAGSSTGARSASTTWSPGLAEDVPPLPHARYRLVAATLTAQRAAPGRPRRRRPAGAAAVGVRPRPARAGAVPRTPTVLHVGRTDHFGLLNHPEVASARCASWLAERTVRPTGREIRCWRTGGDWPWNCRLLRLGSLT